MMFVHDWEKKNHCINHHGQPVLYMYMYEKLASSQNYMQSLTEQTQRAAAGQGVFVNISFQFRFKKMQNFYLIV